VNSTIAIGDTMIWLDENVDWKAGEQIVVASSTFDYNQAEVKIIASTSGNIVTVTTPFIYKHFSVIEYYDDAQ
jgi:hypothetical protein